jgi:hypothetical protein
VKPKTEAQPTENITEPPIPEPKQEVTQPLQEIKQNIPNKQTEVWRTNQTKNIVPTPADINNLPPPPPMVVEKPKKIISVPEPDLPPPPPLLLDVEDEDVRYYLSKVLYTYYKVLYTYYKVFILSSMIAGWVDDIHNV